MPIGARCLICRTQMPNGNKKQYCSKRCKTLKRPFRVWDGEGRTLNDGSHLFTLLACTDGRNREYIENIDGLSTKDCLEFITRKRLPAYNVWFSFGYDINKMLEDIPLDGEGYCRRELWEEGVTKWHGYRIDYFPRKTFTVSHKRKQLSYHSYDVFGFFQTSFLKACEDWKIDAEVIRKGKESRNEFAQWSMEEVREYNFLEMDLLLELCNRLRDALFDADVLPQSWHGPGAIAAVWLKRENIEAHYNAWPDIMHKAVMSAYFGGRIDIATVGEVEVYKYDIASAYPSALCDCISLSNIEWRKENAITQIDLHGLYHVRWRIARNNLHGPFPWRNHKGNVLFPHDGEGWYWGIEVASAQRLFNSDISVLEGWIPYTNENTSKHYPFREAIRRDYKKRAKLKSAGLASNVAIKLALNSIYGKLCQHEARFGKPRWQNYIWGGFVTAHARSKVLDALSTIGVNNCIGIATDGIFLREPLPGAYKVDKTNTGNYVPLGMWENEGYTKMLITAPGLYATLGEEKKIYRSRGLPSHLNFGYVLRCWGCTTKENTEGANSISSTKDTFVGMGRALHQHIPCGRFIPDTKTLGNVTIFGTSKRFPNPIQMSAFKPWKEFQLLPKPRNEKVISYAYKWRKEFDERAERECSS